MFKISLWRLSVTVILFCCLYSVWHCEAHASGSNNSWTGSCNHLGNKCCKHFLVINDDLSNLGTGNLWKIWNMKVDLKSMNAFGARSTFQNCPNWTNVLSQDCFFIIIYYWDWVSYFSTFAFQGNWIIKRFNMNRAGVTQVNSVSFFWLKFFCSLMCAGQKIII